jgi:hypothetical protein
MRTAEMEQMRALVRELRAEAKRLVELASSAHSPAELL